MKKIFSVLLVLGLFCLSAQAQPFTNLKFNLTTTAKPAASTKITNPGDTLSIELGATVTFHDSIYDLLITNKRDTLKSVHYTWLFGDGESADYTRTKTVVNDTSHVYSQSGLYYALLVLKVPNRFKKDSIIIQRRVPIRVNIDPKDFSASSDVSQSMCKTDKAVLTGVARTNGAQFSFVKRHVDTPAALVNKNKKYKKDIINTGFPMWRTFTAKDVDSLIVSINMEHSAAADLEIRLTCPNDSSIALKKYAYAENDNTFMGLPRVRANEAGKPYRFTLRTQVGNEATTILMNNAIQGLDDYKPILSAGYINVVDSSYSDYPVGTQIVYMKPTTKTFNYKPEISYSNLIGCPLNGKWTLTVIDSVSETPSNIITTVNGVSTTVTVSNNDGYVFDWTLNFADTTYKPEWSYVLKYPKSPEKWSWLENGASFASTDAAGDVFTVSKSPNTVGTHTYTFMVYDEWGFQHKRTVDVIASKPVITTNVPLTNLKADPTIELTFTDATPWWASSSWSKLGINDDGTATTKSTSSIYDEKGNHTVYLVTTSKTGCQDTASVTFLIDVDPTVAEVYNIFTPNGDGANDLLKFKTLQGFKSLEGKIFTRWGGEVLEIKSLDEVKSRGYIWDGTIDNKGTKASPGVYYYYFSGRGVDKEMHSTKGFVYIGADK